MSMLRMIFSRANIARPILNIRPQSTDVSSEFYNEKGEEQLNYESESRFDSGESDTDTGGFPRQQRRMNKGVNRVELLGGVAGDPIFKTTQNGSEFASFNMYTNVDRKLNNGETMTITEVHNVVGFGGVAKYIKNNVQRGSRLYLTGRLHYTGGQVLADGTRTTRLASVNVENIYPLAQRRLQNRQD